MDPRPRTKEPNNPKFSKLWSRPEAQELPIPQSKSAPSERVWLLSNTQQMLAPNLVLSTPWNVSLSQHNVKDAFMWIKTFYIASYTFRFLHTFTTLTEAGARKAASYLTIWQTNLVLPRLYRTKQNGHNITKQHNNQVHPEDQNSEHPPPYWSQTPTSKSNKHSMVRPNKQPLEATFIRQKFIALGALQPQHTLYAICYKLCYTML